MKSLSVEIERKRKYNVQGNLKFRVTRKRRFHHGKLQLQEGTEGKQMVKSPPQDNNAKRIQFK